MRDSLIANSGDIKFACSQCGQRIVVERSAAGLALDCPVCAHAVTVPQSSTADSTQEQAGWLEMDVEEARAEIARQHALFKKAVDECERLNANATHVQAESKRFQAERQQLKGDAVYAKQAAAVAEARAAEMAVALSSAQQENDALRAQIENEIVSLRERLTATETYLAVRENELRAGQEENSQVVQALAQAQSELAGLSAEAAGLRKEVEGHQQNVQATAGRLTGTEQQLHETAARLETVSEEHRQSCRQRDEWQQQFEGLQRDLLNSDSGRELLELREKLQQLQQDHGLTETALAEKTTDAQASAATVESLRAELQELRRLHGDAERRAQAGSESQLMKDADVLRGIVARQNTTLGVYHAELRRLRRGRFALRLVYGLFALGLLALGFFACKVFAPQEFFRLFVH